MLICLRRSPQMKMKTAPASETVFFPSAAPFIPPVPTTSALPTPTAYGYGYGFVAPSITTYLSSYYDQFGAASSESGPSSSSTSTAVPIARLEVSTPGQGALVAISIICGLLLLALLFALLVIIGKRYESQQLRLNVGRRSASSHRRSRRHRRDRSEKSETESSRSGMPPGMSPAFLRPGLRPHAPRNMGVQPRYYPDPRMAGREPMEGRDADPLVHNLGGARPTRGRRGSVGGSKEVEELSETSTTEAGGARMMRSSSRNRNRHRSSKASSSRTKARHGASE